MKRIMAAVMLAAFLLSLSAASAADPGSVNDPLVSKSYVDGTFVPAAREDAGQELIRVIEMQYDSLVAAAGLDKSAGYDFASGYYPLELLPGKTVSFAMGSSFILVSGEAVLTVEEGEVFDITAAQAVPSGTEPQPNIRYFCVEDTYASLEISETSVILVNGDFRVDGSVRVEDMYLDIIAGEWYYEAVQFVVENGLYHDLEGEYFYPNGFATRANFVYALWVISGKPQAEYDGRFRDVATDAWYAEAVAWGVENDIVRGHGGAEAGTFAPDDPAERAQEVAFLHRYFKYLERDVSALGDYTTFNDHEDIPEWFLEDMAWAIGSGIIIGNNLNMLEPRKNGERDEVAIMLLRIYNWEA